MQVILGRQPARRYPVIGLITGPVRETFRYGFTTRIRRVENREIARRPVADIKPPASPEVTPEEAIADEAGMMETSPVEESNGFQIFKSGTTADRDPDQAGSGMTANPDTGNSDTGNPESGNPAGNANMDQLNAEVSRWMTNAVRSIVRDEMQQKVDAIARSAVRKALAEFDPKKD